MSDQTMVLLKELDSMRQTYQQSVIEFLDEYIYRERRYKVHFSVALVFSKESLQAHAESLNNTLRKTDRVISIAENLLCVVFDATQEESYVKAAENLYKTLKSIEYRQDYFVATVFSNEVNDNYLLVLNRLFERLYYSLEHDYCDHVTYEDYII